MNSQIIEKDNQKNEIKEENSEIKDEENYSDLNFLTKESINSRDIEEYASLKKDLNPLQKICAKIGGCIQKFLLNLSEKIDFPPLYILFIIFFIIGFFLIIKPMIDFPILIFSNTSLVLLLLSLGNLSFMISFCFYYGSKKFLKIVVDKKNAYVIIGHLIGVIFGLIFINNFHLILIFLGGILFFITPSFLIIFLPGKKQCNKIIDKICEKIRICKRNKDLETYADVNIVEDDEVTNQIINKEDK